MDKRELGTGGPQVAPIGLGCMGMSWGYAESRRDDHTSIEVIRRALDAGVDLLDTAAVYGDGHNERLVGRAITGRRDEVVVATKGGLVVDDLATKRMHRDGRPETLRRQVEDSLTHLGVDRLDLYYPHRVDPDVPIEESWGALAALVAEGKVDRLGLSEVSIAQAEAAHAIHPVSAIQSELSLWTRDPLGDPATDASGDGAAGAGTDAGGDLLAWTRDHGVAFVPFAPLGRGYLTGTLTADGFEDGDFRATNPRFAADAFDRNQAITDEVARIATAHDATPAQVSLAWLLRLSGNIIPIPGTRSGTHLTENLAATELQLTEDERLRLDRLPAAHGSRY
ncbi:aldo/keto reductase [Gordonia otitidis]|uniref:Aldo/keto reductase n=1 Tax=Gordonia otitidis (strain DSM 44809 / CCUG 52243 / JCM 12355 / NBRC 100426 / IFM 10032) TaxID=1108044 RepID=H5TIJ8_GORO1|nr:aldo/keto reductase [Gordonia otitidis]GAB33306.1 putative aldo/keto reductase [Gordonia otitidis NBRC 100426]